jgi:hypothetical protein
MTRVKLAVIGTLPVWKRINQLARLLSRSCARRHVETQEKSQ